MPKTDERVRPTIAVDVGSARRLTVTLIAMVALVSGCLSTSAPRPRAPDSFSIATPLPAPIGEVRKAFRADYDEAIATHLKKLRSNYPIVTQDLLNMTLLRAGGAPERFSMQNGAYFLMAHTSHPLLTVYSILSIDGFGSLSDARIQHSPTAARLLGPSAHRDSVAERTAGHARTVDDGS